MMNPFTPGEWAALFFFGMLGSFLLLLGLILIDG